MIDVAPSEVIVVASPERSLTNDLSSNLVLPTHADVMNQEEQLLAIQNALRSSFDSNQVGSRVLGIVGDFATL